MSSPFPNEPGIAQCGSPPVSLGKLTPGIQKRTPREAKKADAWREPDKGEFTECNKTAFVFVTCKIQRSNSVCLCTGWPGDSVTQPVWLFAAFTHDSLG